MSETALIAKTLELIKDWGGIDGAHHKQWLLDQIIRTLTITPGGYDAWIADYSNGEEGPNTYEWNEGIAP